MMFDRPLAVVTPTVDGDVLTALARADAQLTVRQIAGVVGRFSEEGIRRVLTRLVAQGVVTVETAGRTSAYRFNREHLAADAIIALAGGRERLLDRLRAAFATWPAGVGYAAVFGSVARGGMRTDSDIDLLVIHDDDMSHLEMDERVVDLMLRVKRWTGNSLSLVPMSVAELTERLDEPLFHDIRRDALTVAGSRDWFEAQFRSRGIRRALA